MHYRLYLLQGFLGAVCLMGVFGFVGVQHTYAQVQPSQEKLLQTLQQVLLETLQELVELLQVELSENRHMDNPTVDMTKGISVGGAPNKSLPPGDDTRVVDTHKSSQANVSYNDFRFTVLDADVKPIIDKGAERTVGNIYEIDFEISPYKTLYFPKQVSRENRTLGIRYSVEKLEDGAFVTIDPGKNITEEELRILTPANFIKSPTQGDMFRIDATDPERFQLKIRLESSDVLYGTYRVRLKSVALGDDTVSMPVIFSFGDEERFVTDVETLDPRPGDVRLRLFGMSVDEPPASSAEHTIFTTSVKVRAFDDMVYVPFGLGRERGAHVGIIYSIEEPSTNDAFPGLSDRDITIEDLDAQADIVRDEDGKKWFVIKPNREENMTVRVTVDRGNGVVREPHRLALQTLQYVKTRGGELFEASFEPEEDFESEPWCKQVGYDTVCE